MALFGSFNPLVSGVLRAVGQQGGLLGSLGNVGAQIVSSSVPSTTISSGPVMAATRGPSPGMSQGSVPLMGTITATARNIQAILVSMAAYLGLKSLTLKRAMRIYRKVRRFVVDPYIIAQILGITVEQLGELLISDAARTRRRMNPGNIGALRRAHRRIEGFHKICGKNDKLRATRRRSPGRRSNVVMKCA